MANIRYLICDFDYLVFIEEAVTMGWLEAVVVVLGMICVVGLVVLGLLLMFLLDILMLGLLFPELLLLFAVFVWPGLKDKEEFKKMLQELEEKQKENKDKL